MFSGISSFFSKPEVSMCILSHGEMLVSVPQICMSYEETCKDMHELNNDLQIHDENITITSKKEEDVIHYNITYTFDDLPYIPTYLPEYQENEYKTLTFSAEALIVPAKFTLWFSNIFRRIGISTLSSVASQKSLHESLVQNILRGNKGCIQTHKKTRSNNMLALKHQHNFLKKEDENVEETFERIKCTPMMYKQLIHKIYETNHQTNHIISMVFNEEFLLLDGTFLGNEKCKNRLMQVFKTKQQRKMISLFYQDPHKKITNTKEIMDLLDVLFPYGASLNWYDTSCNYVKNLITHDVDSVQLSAYTKIVRKTLDILNNALHRIPSLAFGKRKKRTKKIKRKDLK
jgi:hypothetical protein